MIYIIKLLTNIKKKRQTEAKQKKDIVYEGIHSIYIKSRKIIKKRIKTDSKNKQIVNVTNKMES